MITGPRRAGEIDGPEQFHVVFLDHNRRRLLGTPYEDMLACIRCGACLNVCPVYRRIGGHAYDSVYPGPMGKVLTPLLSAGDAGATSRVRRRCAARAPRRARSRSRSPTSSSGCGPTCARPGSPVVSGATAGPRRDRDRRRRGPAATTGTHRLPGEGFATAAAGDAAPRPAAAGAAPAAQAGRIRALGSDLGVARRLPGLDDRGAPRCACARRAARVAPPRARAAGLDGESRPPRPRAARRFRDHWAARADGREAVVTERAPTRSPIRSRGLRRRRRRRTRAGSTARSPRGRRGAVAVALAVRAGGRAAAGSRSPNDG